MLSFPPGPGPDGAGGGKLRSLRQAVNNAAMTAINNMGLLLFTHAKHLLMC